MNNPLSKVLPGVPTLHLPIGQASDRAHLSNERIRWENLVKGKHVFKEFLKNLEAQCSEGTGGALQCQLNGLTLSSPSSGSLSESVPRLDDA